MRFSSREDPSRPVLRRPTGADAAALRLWRCRPGGPPAPHPARVALDPPVFLSARGFCPVVTVAVLCRGGTRCLSGAPRPFVLGNVTVLGAVRLRPFVPNAV